MDVPKSDQENFLVPQASLGNQRRSVLDNKCLWEPGSKAKEHGRYLSHGANQHPSTLLLGEEISNYVEDRPPSCGSQRGYIIALPTFLAARERACDLSTAHQRLPYRV